MKALPLSRLTGFCAAAALLAVSTAIPLTAQGPASDDELMASLSGMAQPAGGDTDGSGMFSADMNDDGTQLCYELRVSNIAAPTAAHIHRGAEGESGPPVVSLDAPSMGASEGCVDVDAELATELAGSPGSFYVNVHNEEFGGGAIRGQLAPEMDAMR